MDEVLKYSSEYPNVPNWMRISEYYGRSYLRPHGYIDETKPRRPAQGYRSEAIQEEYSEKYTFIIDHYNRDLGCDEIAILFGISTNDVGRIACVLRKRGHNIPIIHRGRHSKKISEIKNGQR